MKSSTPARTPLFDAIHALVAPPEGDQFPITGHVFSQGKRVGFIDGAITPRAPSIRLQPERRRWSRATRARVARLIAFRLHRACGLNPGPAREAACKLFSGRTPGTRFGGSDPERSLRKALAHPDIAVIAEETTLLARFGDPRTHVLFRCAWWQRDGLDFKGGFLGAWRWREGDATAEPGYLTWELRANSEEHAAALELDLQGRGPVNNPPPEKRGRPRKPPG